MMCKEHRVEWNDGTSGDNNLHNLVTVGLKGASHYVLITIFNVVLVTPQKA